MPVLQAWGFTTQTYSVPDESEIAALLETVGWNGVAVSEDKISVPEGSMIDLGSVAKGYAADLAADTMKKAGVTDAILDLGGTILTM